MILGGFGGESEADISQKESNDKMVKRGSADDASFFMDIASNVIIVPGHKYGFFIDCSIIIGIINLFLLIEKFHSL